MDARYTSEPANHFQIVTSATEGVCEQDISKSCGWIRTKLGGQVEFVTRTSRFDFGEDPDPRIFQVILHH